MSVFRSVGNAYKHTFSGIYAQATMKTSDDRAGGLIQLRNPDGSTEFLEPGQFNMVCFDEMAIIQGDGASSNYFRFSSKEPVTLRVDGGEPVKGTYQELKKTETFKTLNCRASLKVYGFIAENWEPVCLTISMLQMKDYFNADLSAEKSLLTISGFEKRENEISGKKVNMQFPIFTASEFNFFEVVQDLPNDVKKRVLILDGFITERLREPSRENAIFRNEPQTQDFDDLPFGDDE